MDLVPMAGPPALAGGLPRADVPAVREAPGRPDSAGGAGAGTEPVTPALTPALLAYLAGVLDTRALLRTRLVPNSDTVLPHLALSCGDVDLLRWLGALTGVRVVVTARDYDKHRCLEHCDTAHDHLRSVSGRWSVTGVRATVLLCATRPYVRFRADAWDRHLAVGLAADRKAATVSKMAALGWPLPVAWTAL
jgi:hypothetical protein